MGALSEGTENTPMIKGLGAACGLVTRNLDTYRNFSLVTADKANTRLGLGEVCWRYLDPLCLPNTLSLRIGGFTGPELLARVGHSLEASCGAACHTGAGVSSVLVNSFSWGEAGAAETVRLSVGRETSTGDVVTLVRAILEAVEEKKKGQL